VFGTRTRALTQRIAELEAAAGAAPTNATASPRTTDLATLFFGPTARGTAMGVPVLAYIRAQLAGGVASMPLERFRKDPSGDPVKLDDGWCENPDPAPVIPASVFWSWIIDDLFFTGTSTLVVLARDAAGFPVAFRRVLPGQLVYMPDKLAWGWAGIPPVMYMGQEVPGEDVVAIDGAHEGICNYGGAVIQSALNLEVNAGTAAAEPLPNIDLHQTGGEPLSAQAAADMVAAWKSARAVGATAYTPSNLEARTLGGFSAADQQMVEGRQYMATQLARLAGVNPVLVSAAMGSSSSYVYTNQQDYRQAFLDDVLDSYLRAIEGRLSANDVTPRGQYVEFNRDAFTRMPLIERVQIMVGALKGGATPATVDQLAKSLDLDFTMPDEPTPPTPPPAAPTPVPRPVLMPPPAAPPPGAP
jgi:hypothetical protein